MKAIEENKKKPSGLIQLLLVVVIIAVGIVIAVVFIKLKKPPQRQEQIVLAPLVKVERLDRRDIQMIIRGYGTVTPRLQVEIVPQVSGKVVWVNPQFRAGGFIRRGELILKIDPRDYELSLRQANAAVAEAQVMLDLEKAEAKIAKEEWQQLHPGQEPDSPLVFREPQIRQAQARLESAEAGLATANLNLERTRPSLPVDAVIMNERVDLGQYVMLGQSVGAAYGIESMEIEVPLEDKELAWFAVPDNTVSVNNAQSPQKGAIARVSAKFAGEEKCWSGYVVRTTGQVDITSRLISVVVEVSEPFKDSGSTPPLLPGMFVEVAIEGNILKNAIAVPRDAMHNNNEVWVAKDGQLDVQPLDIVRADRDFAYADSGLNDGDMIIVSSLDTVIEDMKVRIQTEDETSTTFAEVVEDQTKAPEIRTK
ncbi:MAG: efflux RND transporter periplasmic adaptor subunit [Sedimentisphaerales bacterium]|nr:efflux RND transporter periplasmic adaptor subunit [Sedimentisphaerales bacterium]